MENLYLGLDVSTKTIGFCLMDEDKNLIKLSHISPKIIPEPENDNYVLYEKYKAFEDYFKSEYSDLNIKGIFIEAPLLASNNVFTVNKLIAFNAMVSHGLYRMGYKPIHITEHEARKQFFPEFVSEKKEKGEIKKVLSMPKNSDKKQLVWEKVEKLEPQLVWDRNKKTLLPEKYNFDMADAYVVCKSGIELHVKK